MDLLSVGRVSVDLYGIESGVGFEGQQTFHKSVGGSPTNVAVAAARLGLRAAIATKVGDDAFGRYVCNRLAEWGVDTTYVGVEPHAQTPLAIVALDPPETPSVIFYRGEAAPDTTLSAGDVPSRTIKDVKVLWVSQGSLAQGSTAEACLAWMFQRTREQLTVLDLDYRPSMWASVDAARTRAQQAIALATVVVGNREECGIAVGTDIPDAAADALLAAGVQLAVVKMGADGVMLASASERVRIPALPIEVVCGVGAGDAFGGALTLGLLKDWGLETMGNCANAAGALVATRLTCADAMPSLPELSNWQEHHGA